MLRHWMRESIRPIDRSKFASGHDGNPRGSVPSKMSGLEGHRSSQAVKRRSVPLHHQVLTSHLKPFVIPLSAEPWSRDLVALSAAQYRPCHASRLVRHGVNMITPPPLFLRPQAACCGRAVLAGLRLLPPRWCLGRRCPALRLSSGSRSRFAGSRRPPPP